MAAETYGLADLQDRPAPAARPPRTVYERVCDQCGAKFVTHYSCKLRCSWECQEEAGRTHKRNAARRRAARRRSES